METFRLPIGLLSKVAFLSPFGPPLNRLLTLNQDLSLSLVETTPSAMSLHIYDARTEVSQSENASELGISGISGLRFRGFSLYGKYLPNACCLQGFNKENRSFLRDFLVSRFPRHGFIF